MSFINWQQVEVPELLTNKITMLTKAELKLLYSITKDYFQNKGCIVDAGCFLGGSTLGLASGLLDKVNQPIIHSYDRFIMEKYTIGKYFPEDAVLGSSFLDQYLQQIEEIKHLVSVHPGDILNYKSPEPLIEILFLDVLKTPLVNDHIVENFFPNLIPGHSLVVQQDYNFHSCNGWIHCTMEYLSDYFEIVDYTPCNSVVFLYTKEIPKEKTIKTFQSMTVDQIMDLHDKAQARFPEKQQEYLKKSKQNLVEILTKQGKIKP